MYLSHNKRSNGIHLKKCAKAFFSGVFEFFDLEYTCNRFLRELTYQPEISCVLVFFTDDLRL